MCDVKCVCSVSLSPASSHVCLRQVCHFSCRGTSAQIFLLQTYARENAVVCENCTALNTGWLTCIISTSLHFESWLYCSDFSVKCATAYETPTEISVACKLRELLSSFILLQGHCYDWLPYLFHALYGSSCQLSLQHLVISVMVDKVPHIKLTLLSRTDSTSPLVQRFFRFSDAKC